MKHHHRPGARSFQLVTEALHEARAGADVLHGAKSTVLCPHKAVPGCVCRDVSRRGVGISNCTTLVYGGRGANPYSYSPSKWARVLRMRALNRSFS